jgi:four helix bundle protein
MANEAAWTLYKMHLFHGAGGSVSEVQSQFYIAYDVGYLSKDEFAELYRRADEVARLISGFIRYLKGASES